MEHTVTECITTIDLVQSQLLLAQGASLGDIGLSVNKDAETPPGPHSIQLRLCAEDPSANFALSIGKITEFHVPGGNGVRVDTSIPALSPVVVGSDFDNMIAKVIVTAASWESVVKKAQRVLAELKVAGVKTNIDVLRGILADPEFNGWNADTQWLENNLRGIVERGQNISGSMPHRSSSVPASSLSQSLSAAPSNVLFRKGDAWSIDLDPVDAKGGTGKSQTAILPHHLIINRVLRNEFPTSLSAEIQYTTPATSAASAKTTPYRMTLSATSTTASSLSSTHKLGDSNDQGHIVLPMSGKLIEMLVEEGDEVEENSVVAFVKQMKMELEVRSPRAGRISWALELQSEDGDDVPEGVLLAELEATEGASRTQSELKGKL